MEALRVDGTLSQGGDSAHGSSDEGIFLWGGELCHFPWEYFGDAADLGAYDIQAAAGCFHDHGAECLCQTRV